MSNVSDILCRELAARDATVLIDGTGNVFSCRILRDGKQVAAGYSFYFDTAIERALINWEEARKPDPRQDNLFKESENASVTR